VLNGRPRPSECPCGPILGRALEGASPLAPSSQSDEGLCPAGSIWAAISGFRNIVRGSSDGCEGPQPSKSLWTNVEPAVREVLTHPKKKSPLALERGEISSGINLRKVN
jgi:hypothetical protein